VISQTLLAVPVWLLFELGLYFSGWFVRNRENTPADAVAPDYTPMSEAEMDAELDRMEDEDKPERR